MRGRGIGYDTGFVHNAAISRERLDTEIAARELHIVRDDLHCNAVRLIGGVPERSELAAACAAGVTRAAVFR